MDWKARLSDAYSTRSLSGIAARPKFADGASPADINVFETAFGCSLPESLRSLLQQTDGVTECIEVERHSWIESGLIVYSIEQMAETNRWCRDRYSERGVDRYCFFSTAGTDGVQFGFRATAERQPDVEVFAWYPDEAPDKCMAPGLLEFLAGWCGGSLTV